VLCHGREIDVEDLPSPAATPNEGDLGVLVPGITMAELERLAIERTLEAVGGSTAKAAELLGISRRKIQYRLKEWGGQNELPDSLEELD